MENTFVIAAIISITFLLAKFLEMRYVDNEPKPLKLLIRDALVVYVSVVISGFIMDQLNTVINETKDTVTPLVFTDNPPF